MEDRAAMEDDVEQGPGVIENANRALTDNVSFAGEVLNDIDAVNVLTGQLQDIVRGAISIAPQVVVALLVLLLTGLLAGFARRVVGRVVSRSRMRRSLKELFQLLVGIAVWTLGLMIAAVIVFPNLTPSSVLAGLGIGSVAIGFAFKDVFENFLAGILILFRREMRIGDYIECEGLTGRVEKIAIRESHILETDGELVIVPNSILFKNPLRILTYDDLRRMTVMTGVAYDEDVDESREVITKAVEACTSVSDRKHVQVFAHAFGASSIDFEVTWWTGSTPVEVRRSRDEVVAAVKRALDDAGIEIPFP
ncbi:MAG: mechanosensitive ion channel family protein [Pseudomonadota bacterium]